jgi:hypothetical protein
MRAATEALPFETPKLSGVAVASMSGDEPGLTAVMRDPLIEVSRRRSARPQSAHTPHLPLHQVYLR